KGSDGGHNGLKDIQLILNTSHYPRIRFGVGSEFKQGRQVDYVLGEWNKEEANLLPERLEHLTKMIENFTTIGAARTMSEFNNK
ncbi:MAG: aminoacyl-tRNA hydrolase, partial [Flavobacteriales bacterium]